MKSSWNAINSILSPNNPARRINRSRKWVGHLWANRYFSTPLDEVHLWAAIKYIELNPVRAKLAEKAEEYVWSSARAHCGLTRAAKLLSDESPFGGKRPHPLTGKPISWGEWLELGLEDEARDRLRKTTSSGRPCGSEEFIARLEKALGRKLTPKKRGRPPKNRDEE